MADPYTTLGATCTEELVEIKKKYRKLCMKHHPDKGGNTVKFQEINEAFELIKKHKENGTNPNQPFQPNGPNQTNFNFNTANDFTNFFVNRARVTKFITVEATISLTKAISGGSYTLTVQYMGMAAPLTLTITVPLGIRDNEVIRYPNVLGNGTIDLNVRFKIQKDHTWEVNGMNITKKVEFTFWDLILGTTKDIPTINSGTVRLVIPPLTEPGTSFKLSNLGVPLRHNPAMRGNMYVKVVAKLPKNIPEDIKTLIEASK